MQAIGEMLNFLYERQVNGNDVRGTASAQVIIRLNKRTDADILETLAACGNVQGYIKALIRDDVSAPTEDGNAR